MTDAELDELERRANLWITEPMRKYADRDDAQRFEPAVLALIAEVRRLRATTTTPGPAPAVVRATVLYGSPRVEAAERLARAVDAYEGSANRHLLPPWDQVCAALEAWRLIR